MTTLRPQFFDEPFDIITPQPGQSVCTAAGGNVLVQVAANEFYSGFLANICIPGSGSAGTGSVVPLLNVSGNTWIGYVPAAAIGPSPGLQNRLFVQALSGSGVADVEPRDFLAYSCGSGSGVPVGLLAAAMQRCDQCRPDRPVPVALQLTLDAAVAPATCSGCDRLNQPTLLQHAPGMLGGCAWLSLPLDFCPEGSLGVWRLCKSAACTWDLVLFQGPSIEIAVYRATTQPLGCSFPLTLTFVRGGDACTAWPATVTLTPAP